MKKFLSILMAIMMVAMLGITAFAASGNDTDGYIGTITIDNAVSEQTYTIYRILALESFDTELSAYSYKATNNWSVFIKSDDIKGAYVNVDEQGYVTWVENADAAAFAKLALKYATDNNINNEGLETATDTTVTFDNLAYGYYLVDSSLGTLCFLNTTKPEITITEKNAAPTTTDAKTVEEDSNGNYGKSNDADITQTVNFKFTITAKKGAQNYVLRDKMDSGLTLDENSITVTAGDTTLNKGTDYTVIATDLTEDCTFEVTFTQIYLDSITADTTIVVAYSATLNENAVVGGDGNKNTAKLTYGDGSETVNYETVTKTWSMPVFKYTGTNTALAGATFTLSKNDNVTYSFVKDADGNYRVANADASGAVNSITTDNTGMFTIVGLDSDIYTLTETAAPAGYNKLSAPITVVITNDGKITVDNDTVDTVNVLNQTGSELPSTGGIGTTIFYVVGGLLMAGAVVLLVTKKKMSVK